MRSAENIDVAAMAKQMVQMQLLMARMAQQVDSIQASSASSMPVSASLAPVPQAGLPGGDLD
eukprot:5351083-Amphidinium_carterae.1